MKARFDALFMRRLGARLGERSEEFSDALLEMLYGVWLDGELHGAGLLCTNCGTTEGVEIVHAHTAYSPTEEDPDPNVPVPYCPDCAEYDRAYWESLWDEYNAGRL
jgi:hypothetical protein